MCDTTQGSLCLSPMKKHQSMWIQWHFFSKPWTKGHWSLGNLFPQVCWGHMCDPTQVTVCPSLMKIHQSVWTQWPFFKNLNQRSLTPRWPLTPCLLRSHVWLYPRIFVSKSHGNTSMFEDTMINFAKYHRLHTTYRMSDHIVSFWTCSGEKKKWDTYATRQEPPFDVTGNIYTLHTFCSMAIIENM